MHYSGNQHVIMYWEQIMLNKNEMIEITSEKKRKINNNVYFIPDKSQDITEKNPRH